MANVMSYFRICLAFILFFIVFLTYDYHKRSSSNRFNKVVVFGDSFSDTGNAYRLTNHAAPTTSHSYQGRRHCDGPIWIDRLEVPEKYAYAFGGAITDNDFVKDSTKFRVPGVRQQIPIYLEEARKNNFDITLPLYIVWIGFNNFGMNPSVDPKLVVNSLMNAIEDLLTVGAKNFLIFNEAPFQAFPCYKKLNQTEFYTQLTDSFNKKLEESLAELQKSRPKTSISMFDNHALITKIISETSSTTFTNTVDECRKRSSSKSAEQCPDPKQYVFYDDIHFSSSVHQLITNAIQPFLSSRFRKTASDDSYIHSF